MSSQNKLLNAWISNNTNLTGGVSLRNEGKTYLTQELKTAGGVDCTASQTINFGSNAPTMSGASIANASIPDAALSSNIAVLNKNPQTFTGINSFSNSTTIFGNLTTSGGINATAVQTIDFGANVPKSTGTPSTGSSLINKTYADANYHPIGNYMDLTTNQTAAGIKTFSSPPVMSGASITTATIPNTSLAGLASLVQTSGNQFINGTKTFQTQSVFQGGTSIIDGQREVIANTNRNLWYGSNTNSNWNARSDNTIIGQQAGLAIGTGTGSVLNTAVGSYALATSSNSNGNVAMGHQAMRYADAGCNGNSCVGTYAALGMLSSCSANNFYGAACGSALITNSSYNWASGESAMSNPFPSIYTNYQYVAASDLTGTYTLTLPNITYLIPTLKAVFTCATGGGGSAIITQVNITTKTLTFDSNTWTCGANSFIYFFARGQLVQSTYSGSTATGTSFTIPAGLLLTSAYRLAYYESASLMKYVDVSTYNNTTGALVVLSSITLFGGSTLYFYNSTTDKGNQYNNNLSLGKYSLANINSGTQNNVAIGIGALNGCYGAYNNINSTYYERCVAIGYMAGANATSYQLNNVFIGSGADVADYRLNYLYDSIAIGKDAKISKSRQIVIGATNNLSFNIAGDRFAYDADTNNFAFGSGSNLSIDGNITMTIPHTFTMAGNYYNDGDIHITGSINCEMNLICNNLTVANAINQPIFNDYVRIINANGNCLFGVNNTGGTVNNVGTNNYAFGENSLANITSTSNNNYSAGISVNGALTQGCTWNSGIGHNVMQTGYNPASTYIKATTTQNGVSSLVLPSISSLVKIGQTINTYSAALNQFVAVITAVDYTTKTITLNATVNSATGTYIYFYDVGKLTATYTPTGSLIGSSFTIATGLAINSNSKCSYTNVFNSAGSVMVSSYNSGTGSIVFASSINAGATLPMYFNDTSETAGTQIWGNTVNGTYSLNRICSYSSFNTVLGYNSLNSSNTTPISYFGGTNNTVIGASCATNLKFLSSNNTLIGCGCDVNSSVDGNNIQYSTAIGAGALIDASNQIKLGRSSETVSIPGTLNVSGNTTLSGNLTNSGTFTPTNIIMSSTTLINGIYAPYLVAPTITGTPTNTVSLPTNPIPGVLFVNNTTSPAADIYITLPLITAEMVGIQIRCKRFGNNNNVRINCASGNTAIGQTSLGSVSQNGQTLIPTAAYNGTLICISMTQWAAYS